MNTAVMPRRSSTGLGAAIAALRACTTLRHRVWMLAIYATLLIVAGLLGALIPSDNAESRAEGLAFFALIANFSIWGGWLSRLLLMQSQVAGLRTPGITGAVLSALAGAAVVTLMLPASVLLALGVPVATALGAAALGLLSGLLFAVLPWPAAVGLLSLPGLSRMLASELPPMGTPHLLAAAFLGVLVLAACVRSIMKNPDPAAIPAWRRPVMLQAPGGMVAWHDWKVAASPDTPQMYTLWLVATPRPEHAGPHAPRAAIDTLLAGPMGYVARRAVVKQWSLLALCAVAVLVTPLPGDTPMVRDALLIGALVGLFAGGWSLALRLERQRRRVSGELAELALLPGLGAPPEAATRLLRSVMVRLGQLMLFALAGVLLMAWIRGIAWPHVALLLGVLAGTGASSVLLCASALTRMDIASARTFFVMLPLLIAGIASAMVALTPLPLEASPTAWAALWIALTAAYLVAARVPLRRFRASPHAFLLD